MKLTKDRRITEASQFTQQFKGTTYHLLSDTMGNIVFCETDNQQAIAWLKTKGLK